MPQHLMEAACDGVRVDLDDSPGASACDAPARATGITVLVLASTVALLRAGPALAVCSAHNPVSGQTITCDTTPPNPDTTPVEAVAGSTNVTVNVLTGAALSTSLNGIFVRDLSRVANAGSIAITGNTFDGIRFDSGNTITNSGAITTNGTLSEGMFSDGGDNNTIVNAGTITTNGPESVGILVGNAAQGNTVTNTGTITTFGRGSSGIGVVGDGNQLIQSGTIVTTGDNAHGILGDGSGNTLTNAGSIDVSGSNAHGVDWLGPALGAVTNEGAITARGAGGLGVFLGGRALLTNTGSGLIRSIQANGVIANGGGTIVNSGAITGQQIGIVLANGAGSLDNSGTIIGVTGGGISFIGNFDDTLVNTGTIAGTGVVVNFAGGNDVFVMSGGSIGGNVDMGAGNDRASVTAGTVTGNIQQGAGTDDFRMTGGTIQSLSQGDNIDTFFMSDGRIVTFFEDGDRAMMTGGHIGRVDMKLDNNVFDMSGGTIDGNLVTGFGNDTIILSDGLIGGNISVSGGADRVTITGGAVGGNVLMSTGADMLLWEDGGIVYGSLDLGPGDDTATLRNLSNGNLGAVAAFNGNAGTDTLTMHNVSTGGIGRLRGWEAINARDDTELTFDGTLTLGDAGTGTGKLTVDATSTIFGGGADGGVAPFSAGQLADVINAGRIDLTNSGSAPGDTFTIIGNYTGSNGLLFLDTQLGNDSSATDKLVISQGAVGGFTSIGIVNAGGTGDATASDGIMVVEARDGATTGGGSFALAGPVAAGAYEYLLFKGGVSGGTEQDWYLRSTLIPAPPVPVPPAPAPVEPPLAPDPTPLAPVAPEPPVASPEPIVTPPPTPGNPDPEPVLPDEPPTVDPPAPPPLTPTPVLEPPPIPDPARPDQVPPTPGATPVIAAVVPLYRIETPTYSVVPPLGQTIGLAALGTFHERRGEQFLMETPGGLPAAWGRVYGQDDDIKWSGTVSPSFDGSLAGFQVGLDLFGWDSLEDHSDRAGIFIGRTSANGDVKGQALGWNDLSVGSIDLDGTSFGGYWTHVGPQGWYVDAVLMGTWLDGDATSARNVGIGIDGTGITASLEGGYPLPVIETLTFEPQAQLVWQRFDLDDTADRFSSVSFDEDGSLYGRIGFRVLAELQAGGTTVRPYGKLNLWHGFSGSQEVILGTNVISTETDWTALEVGGGLVAEINKNVAFHATADYTTNVGGEKQHAVEGNIGLTIGW